MNGLKTNFNSPEQIRVLPKVTLKKELVSHPLLLDRFTSQRDQVIEQGNPWTCTLDKERQTVSFKNPFDIPRNRLVQQVRTYNHYSMTFGDPVFTAVGYQFLGGSTLISTYISITSCMLIHSLFLIHQ